MVQNASPRHSRLFHLVIPTRATGLHGHHLPAPALDRREAGVPGEQEPESGRAPGGAALGARHLHRGLQEVLPPRHHRGEPSNPHLPQRHRPLRSEVRGSGGQGVRVAGLGSALCWRGAACGAAPWPRGARGLW